MNNKRYVPQFLCIQLQESILQDVQHVKSCLLSSSPPIPCSFYLQPIMAVVLRNTAVSGLAVTYQGVGTALNVQPATGVAEQTISPNLGLGELFQTYFFQWDLTPSVAGAPSPRITIESVSTLPDNLVSPQGANVMPNPTQSGWNIIPMEVGTFQFIFFLLTCYHTYIEWFNGFQNSESSQQKLVGSTCHSPRHSSNASWPWC